MSLIGIFGPSPQQSGKSGGPAKTEPPKKAAEEPRAAEPKEAPASPLAGPTGSAAPAERTQAPPAVAQMPPPAAARPANVASATRAGADGREATAAIHDTQSARDAQFDRRRIEAAFAPDLDENRARRFAEAAQDRLITQEILSRIPVPIEALPRLTADATRDAEAKSSFETRRSRLA